MTTPVSTSEVGYANASPPQAGWWGGLQPERAPDLVWPMNLTTYDYMRRRNGSVVAGVQAVTLPVERTTWRIDGRGCDPAVARHVAEDFGLPLLGDPPSNLGRTKGRFSWAEHLRFALEMIVFGFQPFEQVYRYDDRGRVRLAKLAPRPPRTVSAIDVARDGGLQGIRQWNTGIGGPETKIPVERLVMYTYRRDAGSWWGNSALRPAYKYVLMEDPNLRVWAQLIERTGMGVITYTAGPDSPDAAAEVAEGLKLVTALRAGDRAGASVRNGAAVALQGLNGAIPDARALLQYGKDSILEVFLANFLKLDAKGGSYALASVQEATFTQSLQALAQQIADVTNAHVIEDLVDAAFGEGEPAPKLVFDEIGSRINLTLEGLTALTQGDRPVLYPDREVEQHIRARLGLPLKTDTAPVPPPAVDV